MSKPPAIDYVPIYQAKELYDTNGILTSRCGVHNTLLLKNVHLTTDTRGIHIRIIHVNLPALDVPRLS